MKKINGTLIVVLISAILVIPPGVIQTTMAQTEVALLTQPEGNVRVKRGKRGQSAKEDMLLDVGDVVSVDDKGTAVIYQAYVPVTRLGANQRFKVKRQSPPPPQSALTSEEFNWFKVHYLAARQNRRNASPVTMGGPENASLTLLEPRNSIVISRLPTFIWSRVKDATKYTVNIYDKNESVLCTESTADTQLTLPNKCQQLKPGDYYWDVTAQIGNQVSDNPYDATTFIIVTEQRGAEISNTLKHAQAMSVSDAKTIPVYISALMEHKLYPQAEAELRRALELAPTDQVLWALLIETYARMKRWREREKAREISVGNPSVEMIHTLGRRM